MCAGMHHEALAAGQSAFELRESLLGADHKDTVAARHHLNKSQSLICAEYASDWGYYLDFTSN